MTDSIAASADDALGHGGESLSGRLRRIAAGPSERISVGEIAEGLGHRSFGALMIAFAFPNMLPLPPGASAVLGAPLIVLSAQLMLGRLNQVYGVAGSNPDGPYHGSVGFIVK